MILTQGLALVGKDQEAPHKPGLQDLPGQKIQDSHQGSGSLHFGYTLNTPEDI